MGFVHEEMSEDLHVSDMMRITEPTAEQDGGRKRRVRDLNAMDSDLEGGS